VEAIYDRHGYLSEKRAALETGPDSLSLILSGSVKENVVELEDFKTSKNG
jgi:hypothetical protein